MTTKTDELKPCPFCGSADIHIAPDEVGSGGQWVGPVHVVCGGDCVAGQTGDDKESAVAAWNRRAALQSQDREDVEFQVSIEGEVQAQAFGPRDQAWAEIQRYAAQYAEDGPIEIWEVIRRRIEGER